MECSPGREHGGRPKRQRLVRLPEPPDDKVGRRIKLAFTDERLGCRWFSAKIILAVPRLSYYSNSLVEYRIRFDFDGEELQVDLNEVSWEWLCDEEPAEWSNRLSLVSTIALRDATVCNHAKKERYV